MSLQGKVILITGASQGIGKACAERVGREGASVVINYNSSADSANAVVKSIGEERAMAVQANASKIEDIEKLVNATVERFGRIDVVMANAGVMPLLDLENTTPEDFDNAINLLVKGPYFLAQKAVPHMPKGGRVILLSSGSAHNSSVMPQYLLYDTAKGAIEQMTRVMSKDLARKGILVNAIAPGPIATDMLFNGKDQAWLDTLKNLSPFKRYGQPEEIAGVMNFLCGEDSSWVSGQILHANGATLV